MIDRNIVAAKLAKLDKRVRRVQATRRDQADAYAADETAAELVAFNLMLAVRCARDLAAHLIADQEWPPASTAAEQFDRPASKSDDTPDASKARDARVRDAISGARDEDASSLPAPREDAGEPAIDQPDAAPMGEPDAAPMSEPYAATPVKVDAGGAVPDAGAVTNFDAGPPTPETKVASSGSAWRTVVPLDVRKVEGARAIPAQDQAHAVDQTYVLANAGTPDERLLIDGEDMATLPAYLRSCFTSAKMRSCSTMRGAWPIASRRPVRSPCSTLAGDGARLPIQPCASARRGRSTRHHRHLPAP